VLGAKQPGRRDKRGDDVVVIRRNLNPVSRQ